MFAILHSLAMFVIDFFKSPRRLEAENLFLRHQLSIALRRAPPRLRLRGSDRALMVWLTRLWPSLLGAAHVVQPETILRWHRIGFTAFWRWKSRKRAHAQAIAAIDLFVVPALTFERLFAFLVLGHGRRQLLWFEVTRHPTAEWLARQITEAFPWASAPTYLVRDNDRAYGHVFRSRVRAMGIRDRPISPGSSAHPHAVRLLQAATAAGGGAHRTASSAQYSAAAGGTPTTFAVGRPCPVH